VNPSQPEVTDRQVNLQPFARAFQEVTLEGVPRIHYRHPGKRTRSRLAKKLDAALSAERGHPLHPAIVCFALASLLLFSLPED